MLVLSRKPGERLLIGAQIAITIVRIGPNVVKVGIEAPRDMTIIREELAANPEAQADDAVRRLIATQYPAREPVSA